MHVPSVSNYCQSISNYMPKFGVLSKEQLAMNVNKIAIPIVFFVSSSMVMKAEATRYVECVDSCNDYMDTYPLAKLLCYALCAIFSKN